LEDGAVPRTARSENLGVMFASIFGGDVASARENEMLPLSSATHDIGAAHDTSRLGKYETASCEKEPGIPAGSVQDKHAFDAVCFRLFLAGQIGIFSGLLSGGYYYSVETLLWAVWEGPLSASRFDKEVAGIGITEEPKTVAPVWLVVTCAMMGLLVGLSMMLMGEPSANLPALVQNFHAEDRHLSCSVFRTVRIAIVSGLSIAGAGSLGPEAPLVSMGGGVAFYVAKYWNIEKQPDVCICTLAGMSSGLGAFFGQPIAGALFSLEVVHRYGLEYFEALLPSIFAAIVGNCVFRGMVPMGSEAIWRFADKAWDLHYPPYYSLLYGVPAGLVGGLVGSAWNLALSWSRRNVCQRIPSLWGKALLGGIVVGLIGTVAPASLFWGELEIAAIIKGDLTSLPHLPEALAKASVIGKYADLSTASGQFVTGVAKLASTMVTVLAGYRGGYIFPLMNAGFGIGLGFAKLFGLDEVLLGLPFAVAFIVPGTRTWLAIPLVGAYLSARWDVFMPCVVASIVALMTSSKTAAIAGARSRTDLKCYAD